MPRKAMFNREDFIDAALEIARESGIGAVTARELGSRMGCSSRPMFTYFGTVDELKREVFERALELYRLALESGLSDADILRGVWTSHMGFAKAEPMLYRLISGGELSGSRSISDIISGIFGLVRERLMSETGLDGEAAREYFGSVWLLANGAAGLAAVSGALTDEESEALYRRGSRGLYLSFAPEAALTRNGKAREQSSRSRRIEEWID